MSFDPVAIVTTVGILLGSITGTPTGYGFQVGAVIRPGESVEVGVDPILYYESEWLADIGVGGITLGTTTLVVPATWYVEREVEYLASQGYTGKRIERWLHWYYRRGLRSMLAYEAGHRDYWARFGIMYPIEMLSKPCDYDPAYPWYGGCPGPKGFSEDDGDGRGSVLRGAYARVDLPVPEHYAVKFTVWKAP